MLHNGLKYVGFLIMLIFGGVFLLKWFLHDELLLDQLIAFVIGFIFYVASLFVKAR
ncbi:hypothetical protein ACQKMV_21805 [Lysinibacillus sp. NPDC094403]|uniref:hypothetical protein n=1 Tax=Lysinibacillus sp. NPDC094403 TaxID=3390581 RepID=UPI003D0551DF